MAESEVRDSDHTFVVTSLVSVDYFNASQFLGGKQGVAINKAELKLCSSVEEIQVEYNNLKQQSVVVVKGVSVIGGSSPDVSLLDHSAEQPDNDWLLVDQHAPPPSSSKSPICSKERTDKCSFKNSVGSANLTNAADMLSQTDSDRLFPPICVNMSDFHQPELPPMPSGLSSNQMYAEPVLKAIPDLKASAHIMFREAEEIFFHHKMFQIQLSDSIRKWDCDEKIGHVFTASFSKATLVDAYSMFVNNFAVGMDEIREAQRCRSSFAECLKVLDASSEDRLSIYSLMVKPVQRFPQFIMLLQDLIKHTPHRHQDRPALQLALTELDNIAHMLNERKRLSDRHVQAKQTVDRLTGQLSPQILPTWDHGRRPCLIRLDNFNEIFGEVGNIKSSRRRLILLTDLLVCVKVEVRTQNGFKSERYRVKWAVPLRDVQLTHSTTVMPGGELDITKLNAKRLAAIVSQLEGPCHDPFHLCADLRDLLHDLAVFGRISRDLSLLRRSYHGYNLSKELINEVVSDLREMIQLKAEQVHLVDSCSVNVIDLSRPEKPHHVLQTATPAQKHDWCMDFVMAQLDTDTQNRPGWFRSGPSSDQEMDGTAPLFMRCVPVDVPRCYASMSCASPVYIPSLPHTNGVGVQHLLVCASSPSHGHVSVVSLPYTHPIVTESFKACDTGIVCAEAVTGCGRKTDSGRFLFHEDTVWLGTMDAEIVIIAVSQGAGHDVVSREAIAVLKTQALVMSMRFVDERVFCGLETGAILVYSRNDAGEWCVHDPVRLRCGRAPIVCQVVIGDKLWAACSNRLFVVDIDSLKISARHTLSLDKRASILHMVQSGVGVWVAFQGSAVVYLIHLETMEHLQEMSVDATVNRILLENGSSFEHRECFVTCLATSTGFLWIGTSNGFIVTLPLPRLSDGVPLYHGHPSVSCHAHSGPVRFLIPVHLCDDVVCLHGNSSLGAGLRARPSSRNKIRQRLETEGQADGEALLSRVLDDGQRRPSGVNDSHPVIRQDGKCLSVDTCLTRPDPYILSLPRRSVCKKKSVTLDMIQSSPHRRSSRFLSFRTELANRIKSKAFGHFVAKSMYDIRVYGDVLDVETLYGSLLDGDLGKGGVGENVDRQTVVLNFDELGFDGLQNIQAKSNLCDLSANDKCDNSYADFDSSILADYSVNTLFSANSEPTFFKHSKCHQSNIDIETTTSHDDFGCSWMFNNSTVQEDNPHLSNHETKSFETDPFEGFFVDSQDIKKDLLYDDDEQCQSHEEYEIDVFGKHADSPHPLAGKVNVDDHVDPAADQCVVDACSVGPCSQSNFIHHDVQSVELRDFTCYGDGLSVDAVADQSSFSDHECLSSAEASFVQECNTNNNSRGLQGCTFPCSDSEDNCWMKDVKERSRVSPCAKSMTPQASNRRPSCCDEEVDDFVESSAHCSDAHFPSKRMSRYGNTLMVISGGDGYHYLAASADDGPNAVSVHDPCVIFWLYKY